MELTPQLLLSAYAQGVFPMAPARESSEIRWIDPHARAHFPLESFHVSRSLARHIRRTRQRVTVDRAFAAVVDACADREETWINDEIFRAYVELHRLGAAHSVEVWDGERLVGGVYGVSLGAAFFGESMFSRVTNASKVALTYLVHRLRAGGFCLFDVQFLTEHLASLGAEEIPRIVYRAKLKDAIGRKADFTPPGYPPEPEPEFVLEAPTAAPGGRSQPSTQTS